MNDHNLDDLIIDNIDPKNSKTKSFLTIIALAIVVLIVAIILTKIILKDPNDKLVLEEDTTELISPNLTLQSITKADTSKTTYNNTLSNDTHKSIQTTSEKIIEPKKTVELKPKIVEITQEFSQAANIKKEKTAKRVPVEKAIEKNRLVKQKLREKKLAREKKEVELKKSKELQAKKTTTTGYFIQVGSFSQTPSTRFLSVIKNAGFNYHITSAASNGTKKLLIGSYNSRSEVNTALIRVKDRINKNAFVIKK